MTPATRMAIEQSMAVPPAPLPTGLDPTYETQIHAVRNPATFRDERREYVYEISWIPERQCWRRFLRSTRTLEA